MKTIYYKVAKSKECIKCGITIKPTCNRQKYCERCNPRLNNGYYKRNRRKYLLKYKYNITIEEYDHMLVYQNGVCAICKQVDVTGRRLAVDHDHETGKIRGLLCSSCNTKLGWMKRYNQEIDSYLEINPPLLVASGLT